MEVIEQHWEWVQEPSKDILNIIEGISRTCYRSYDKVCEGSAEKMVDMLIRKGHHAMIEFGDATIKCVTNRAISHELVRHRIASYAQASTRYINYGGEDIQFIKPSNWDNRSKTRQDLWMEGCKHSEMIYKDSLRCGDRPEEARDLLNHAVATEINIKTNFRSWRNIFETRCDKTAHYQIRALMKSVLADFVVKIPVIFDDLSENFFDIETIQNLLAERAEYFGKIV